MNAIGSAIIGSAIFVLAGTVALTFEKASGDFVFSVQMEGAGVMAIGGLLFLLAYLYRRLSEKRLNFQGIPASI